MPPLCQRVFDHVAVDVGQAEVAALEAVGEPLVIQPELVQHGRVQAVHVAFLIDRAKPELIRLADDVAGLDAAAGHPHRERGDVMVAPRRLPRLAHQIGRASCRESV